MWQATMFSIIFSLLYSQPGISTLKTKSNQELDLVSEPNVGSTTVRDSAHRERRTLIQEWSEMIKIEHTVFALPFALSGLVLACPTLPSLPTVVWTILAFAGARAAAMTLNRLIDANIDALNPRTSDRAVAAGRIGRGQAAIFAVASFALMLLAASKLPALCLWLSPIAILWLSFYSYTKRFTWLCHLVLGVALGGAALGGWVAASGQLSGIAPWLLALAVSTWVAGFDLIYACQDVDFDRHQKLHSLPSRFGIATALNLSSLLHILTVSLLVALGVAMQLGVIYWAGIILVAAMLSWEHSLVKPTDLCRVNAAFFNINGFVSIAAFLAILLDKIL
jgi:4-hydroxybenzoate polyprenyltransferase